MSVVISGLGKRFAQTNALAGIDLSVGADELLVVLGPSGAGKTTLLRCIAGLETPDAGSIAIGGRDVTRAAPADRDVALVFQNFSLYPEWTVRANIAFPLRAPGRRLDEAAIAERVAWAARVLKLGDYLDRPAERLSGGQMQRVAIGRAIVRRPRLFLMDEPLTNLDAKLRESLRVELAVLRRELATPMVYVTHDQAEALSMADRIAVLDHGRILQIGTPEEVYRAPASPAVARQLGQPAINLLDVVARGGWWWAGAARVIPCVDGHPTGAATLGIRPEDISPEGGTDEAVVEVAENLGPARTALVRWHGLPLHLLLPKAIRLARGDCVRPRFASERVLVWPRASSTAG